MTLTPYETMMRTHRQRQAREAYRTRPLVRTGPGGDYVDDYTPTRGTGPARRYADAIIWSVVCVAFGASAMAALVLILNLI